MIWAVLVLVVAFVLHRPITRWLGPSTLDTIRQVQATINKEEQPCVNTQ